MKRIITALVILLAFATLSIAGDNLWSLDQRQKDVVFDNAIRFNPVLFTAAGTAVDESFIQLNSIDATMTVNLIPKVGQFFVVTQTGTNTDVSTVLLPTGVTWNGTNRGATFNAAGETLVAFAVSSTRLVILENLGTVGFSN